MQQEKSIHLEQVKLLYRNLKVSIPGSLFVLGAIIWATQQEKDSIHTKLLGGIMLVLLLLRYVDGLLFKKAQQKSDISPSYWEKRFLLGIFLLGVLWGAIFQVIFSPAREDIVLFVVCFYAGLISSASATTAPRFPAFVIFMLPATLPLVFCVFQAGGSLYTAMGFAFIIFMFANIMVAATYSRIIRDSIRLRFENLDLIVGLEREKTRAEKNQRLAEQAMIAKDKFLAAASHDLRQPLHAQGLYLDAIETYVQSRGVEHLMALRKTNEALANLFNSLLDVSRLNAGIVEVNNCHIGLRSIILPLQEEFKSQETVGSLTLMLECNNSAVLFTDPILLARILRNLLSNAIRYTRQGSVTLSCLTLNNNTVRISVIDTGIGIPESEQENIFTEYYQLENPERDSSKGLGLGLAIVKKLCALMEIPIICQSVVGEGSTFSLDVSCGDSRLICCKEHNNTVAIIAGLIVLVIDDERNVLESMRCLLSQWGCAVITAESVCEALEKITKNHQYPQLIISDYRLREEETGAQAIAAVRQQCKANIPAILITGDTSEERLREANASGLYLLHKPVAPSKLRTVMNQLVSILA